MSMKIVKPGLLTTVQDLGRWGYQSGGVPVSGAMDPFSFRVGNVLLGNAPNDAALEITALGPEVVFGDERCVALTGADLGMKIDGAPAEPWRVYRVLAGSRVAFGGMSGGGCRGYLCVSGGIDVAPVMGSRATYTRAKMGGFEGRALAAGDSVRLCDPYPLWRSAEGFVCPAELRPIHSPDEPLMTTDGPQLSAFSEEGIAVFYGEAFTVSNEADRMGYRLDGPEIARVKPADIVSDGICWGAVQIPGHGKPIVMMADRQTTGGYTKIAVVSLWSVAALSMKMSGESVRFKRVSPKECAALLAAFERNLARIDESRATYRSRNRYWGY